MEMDTRELAVPILFLYLKIFSRFDCKGKTHQEMP
jgi:hypothetical protein